MRASLAFESKRFRDDVFRRRSWTDFGLSDAFSGEARSLSAVDALPPIRPRELEVLVSQMNERLRTRCGAAMMRFVYRSRPNQALQPTRMLVTFRAYARPAPSTRVAVMRTL